MLLPLLAYLGAVLTILSPCIRPVLPFVFARADRPFLRSGLPMLVGMALTFAVVATLAAVAGVWAVAADQYGRAAAIVMLALFGVALLVPRTVRPGDPAARAFGQQPVQQGGAGQRRVGPAVPASWRRHRFALGTLRQAGAGIDSHRGGAARCQSRHHLVIGPGQDGKPVRFRVTVDGAVPGDNHGTDIAADGHGTVTSQRLYHLVRQTGAVGDHTFEITFLDPGVQAFAFTFG